MFIPLWLQCTHLLMATSSRIMHHLTKLKSSQTGFLNMKMSSLYSNGLHSPQISIQESTFGMWWNGRFASWMCSRQICSNCVMLSCQYGPKSLRNVSNTLLTLCHLELRQFWRQKVVQPGTSKVYLIKWPVTVCYAINHRIIEQLKLRVVQLSFWKSKVRLSTMLLWEIEDFWSRSHELLIYSAF